MTSTFTILHLDCHSCAMAMEGVMEDTPGVTKAEVNVTKRQLIVEHDDQLQSAKLQDTLAEAGYPVEPVVS
ncbi:MAG: heavy-metal-associated domain-containing protein [Candidatus Kerfeldbacteria bacterium]|nr:heavy-metal-associated domain-containing protein [Candidatus Kerfeldbacteria bacterium]